MIRLRYALVALLLLLVLGTSQPGAAQTVTRIGSVATLDVGAWNVEQFQNSDPQMANVVATIQQAGVDVWALQEVTSRGVLDALMARLGSDWDARLSSSSNLYTAFVYRADMVTVRSTGPMFTGGQFNYEFAGRPPQVLDADVSISGQTQRIFFVSLHMKCCSDATSYQRRSDASTALKNRLDFLHASDQIVVMGDFNDETDRSITFGRTSPYANFVSDPDYEFLIADGVVGTFCGSNSSCRTGSTIDNILISSELQGALIPGSADRFDELLSELPNYVFSTSDHLPVVARFDFASTSARDDLPSPQLDLAAWPSPARGQVSVQSAEPGDLEVFSLVGQRVHSARHPGGTVQLDVSHLPQGLYFVRIQARTVQASVPLAVLK